MSLESLGMLAGILTTTSFLPQVVQLARTRSVADVSTLMYSIYCSGLLLWVVYGIYLESMPILLSNSITLLLALAILIMKILWREKKAPLSK